MRCSHSLLSANVGPHVWTPTPGSRSSVANRFKNCIAQRVPGFLFSAALQCTLQIVLDERPLEVLAIVSY